MEEQTTDPRQSATEQHQPNHNGDIQHFMLEGILPGGHILAVCPRLGIIALLADEGSMLPHVLGIEHFGDIELLLLLQLLRAYPRYCPSEVLLASFTGTRTTAAALVRARQQLQDDGWENTMQPIVAALSRCRPRLANLGLKTITRVKQGYQLLGSEEKKGTSTNGRTTR